MRNFIIGVVILVLAAGIFWFFFRPRTEIRETNFSTPANNNLSGGEQTPKAEGMPQAPAPSNNQIKEFTVVGSNFKFSVGEIRVKKGDTVKIVFKNEQGHHDWQVDEFNAATKAIEAGEQDTVQFVADKVGQFEYYCSVMQHRKMGMKGTLMVE